MTGTRESAEVFRIQGTCSRPDPDYTTQEIALVRYAGDPLDWPTTWRGTDELISVGFITEEDVLLSIKDDDIPVTIDSPVDVTGIPDDELVLLNYGHGTSPMIECVRLYNSSATSTLIVAAIELKTTNLYQPPEYFVVGSDALGATVAPGDTATIEIPVTDIPDTINLLYEWGAAPRWTGDIPYDSCLKDEEPTDCDGCPIIDVECGAFCGPSECPCPGIAPTACCEYTGLCSSQGGACTDVQDCHSLFPDDDDSRWRCTGLGCQIICDGLGADWPCMVAGLGACLPADYACYETFPSDCTGRISYPGTPCTPDPFSPGCGMGACCTPLEPAGCAEAPTEELCYIDFNGTAFYEGVECADPNPCLGACCPIDGSCAEGRASDCVNNGGMFLGGGTACPPDGCCPDFPPTFTGADECADAMLAGTLPAESPLQIWGDNWLASGPDSCTDLAPDPVWWETFALIECSDVAISYCCTTADLVCIGGHNFGKVCTTDVDCPGDPAGRCLPIMGSVYVVLYDACPCGDGNSYYYDDYPGINVSRDLCPGGEGGDDPSPTIIWRNLLPGTYYYPIISDENLSNVYTMTLTATEPSDPTECEPGAEFSYAESCADHAAAGELCIDLSTNDVDPRICAVTRLRANFSDVVSNIDVAIECANGGTYNGTTTVTVYGTLADIALSPPLPEEDYCTATLGGDASGSFTVRTLKGDVDRNGLTLGSDMLAVKLKIGGTLDGTTAPFDVDCTGAILGSDMLAVKPYIGNSAPACP